MIIIRFKCLVLWQPSRSLGHHSIATIDIDVSQYQLSDIHQSISAKLHLLMLTWTVAVMLPAQVTSDRCDID